VVTEDAPVVLIFDDADSMDEESVAVLRGTLRDIPRAALLVCLVTNTMHQRDDLDHLRAKIGRDIPGASVTIGALDQPALHGMISWALPGYDATQVKRLGRRLAMDSAGLPLLATELLHAVACGLDLQTLATAWPEPLRTLDQSMPGDLPDTVVGSIRVGFRQLSEDAQAVLQAVAVMPDRAEPERLGHLLELPVDRVLEALDELEWTRWLMSEPRGYSFVARITQKVIARDMLTPGQRQRLRVRLGEVTPGDR
jgi:predicted ATPase